MGKNVGAKLPDAAGNLVGVQAEDTIVVDVVGTIDLDLSKPVLPPVVVERQRDSLAAVVCPACDADAVRVASTRRTHPAFIEGRTRHYKCSACGHAFKGTK